MISKSTVIGLCGSSGIGKTLTCQKLVLELRHKGITCCGFISPAVFEGNQKIAIKVQWIESGEERVLMTPASETSQLKFGRWQLHQDAFSWIEQELRSLQDCEVVFFDEIGPLEVLEGKGWVKALDILDERRNGICIITFRPALQDYFRQRYPDMSLYDLEQQNDGERVFDDVKRLIGIN